MALVGRDVVFVTKVRHRDLHLDAFAFARLDQGPAGIPVLLPEFGRLILPILGEATFLDRGFLVVLVALFGCRHQGGIDNLPRQGQIARCFQITLEAIKELIDGPVLLASRLLRSVLECWNWCDFGHEGGDDFAQKLSQPSEDEAQVVTGCDEDGIGLVAVSPLEVVAAQMAL